MKPGDRRTCKICATQIPVSREVCPVCILRAAIAEEASELVSSRSILEPVGRRFENYELMLHADGRPIELGRGIMGITQTGLPTARLFRWDAVLPFIFITETSRPIVRLRSNHENDVSVLFRQG